MEGAPALELGNSLFDQPWWLEATSPGSWDAAVVRSNGEIVARLPYVVRRRFGLTYVVQPPLTQSLGPWLAETDHTPIRRVALENRLLQALIAELPQFDLFSQNLSPCVGSWLPFHWNSFDVTARVTYRLTDLSDLDAVWSGFDADVRAQIRRAETRLEVRDDRSLDSLLELNRELLRQKRVTTGYDDAFVHRLDAACAERNARTLLVAERADGTIDACVYVVADERCAYYLMGGRSSHSERGATSLLLWHAIRRAANVTRAFDFEGSMIESIERYFRSFGARQVSYLHARKENPKARALRSARSLVAGRAREQRQ